MFHFHIKFCTSIINLFGRFQSRHGLAIQSNKAPPGESRGTDPILSRSRAVVEDSLERWSTSTAMSFDILLTCSTKNFASRKASNTCKHLIRIEVSSSFLQYFFSQAYMILMLSTYRITNRFFSIFGFVTKGSSKPTHSSALLLLPHHGPFESLSLVIRSHDHLRPAQKLTFPFLKPTDATPRSPGSVKFLQTPLFQLRAAPAVSDKNFTAVRGGARGGRQIGKPFLAAKTHFF